MILKQPFSTQMSPQIKKNSALASSSLLIVLVHVRLQLLSYLELFDKASGKQLENMYTSFSPPCGPCHQEAFLKLTGKWTQ